MQGGEKTILTFSGVGARALVALLLGALVTFWGAWSIADAVSRERWLSTAREGNAGIEVSRDRTEAYLQAASIAQNAVLPPDYATAEKMLQEAIRRDPLSGGLWLELARAQIYQGKREHAAVSLMRSDELYPRYPAQRIEAIKLWMLLGDRQRAVEQARHVGLMDFDLTLEMARTLRMLGKSPAEIFDLLEGERLDSGEMSRLLSSIRSENPQRMRELFHLVPSSMYQSLESRRALAELAMQPLVPEVALQVWQMENRTLSVVHPGDELRPPLLAENLRLELPLPERDFVFGWQPLVYTDWSGMRWLSPQDMGEDHGALSLIVDHLSQPSRTTLRYTFYRLILPADVGLKVGLRMKTDPPGRSRCHLRIQPLGGDAVESVVADTLRPDWQMLEAELPPAHEARTVELILVRAPRGTSISESPSRIYIGALQLEPVLQPILEVSKGGPTP